tara:strand:- start:189 stop:416 length:228 start_codon:yes stop_codon:yes gene_type:complete
MKGQEKPTERVKKMTHSELLQDIKPADFTADELTIMLTLFRGAFDHSNPDHIKQAGLAHDKLTEWQGYAMLQERL